jgi:hypothetical protein
MLHERLIEAYCATDYALFLEGGGEIVLKIGAYSTDFELEMSWRGAEAAVIVTAFNPRSAVLPDAENRLRHDQLCAILEARGYAYALGEGRDPTGVWQAETSCVVFGIGREAGLALARAFEQNAIVLIELGRAPELVLAV